MSVKPPDPLRIVIGSGQYGVVRQARQEILDEFARKKQESAYWMISGGLGSDVKDLSRISEPIHRVFANWGATADEIVVFTKRFGILDAEYCGREPFIGKKANSFFFLTGDWQNLHALFCRWWKEPFAPGMFEELKAWVEYNDAQPLKPVPTVVVSKVKRSFATQIVAPDLWRYLVLLFLGEEQQMLRVCRRSDCPAPYFIATRRDQKYCGTDCSQLVATRNWWSKHGKEWRRKRKKEKGKKKSRR